MVTYQERKNDFSKNPAQALNVRYRHRLWGALCYADLSFAACSRTASPACAPDSKGRGML